MRDWYDKGYHLGKTRTMQNIHYPLANRLAAEIVLFWGHPKARSVGKGKRKGSDPVADSLPELRRYAETLRQTGQSFWDWCAKSNWLLLKALYEQRLTPQLQKDIVNGYQEAGRREGSARHLDSVIENIRFFEAMLDTAKSTKDPSRLAQNLQEFCGNISSGNKRRESEIVRYLLS